MNDFISQGKIDGSRQNLEKHLFRISDYLSMHLKRVMHPSDISHNVGE